MNPKVDFYFSKTQKWQKELEKLRSIKRRMCRRGASSLKTAFDALTPGRQRAYILYFSEPKQSKTRESRIEKCTQQILNGKGLNDQ